MLTVITLGPALYLVVTSLTPLNLVNPQSAFDFSHPLGNYQDALTDSRFLNSVWVQVKLSVATVVLQLAAGLGVALLLNADSRLLEAIRTAFLIPMVLPPIVVAIIWKVIYTPDVSPLHRALAAVGLPLGSLITNADTAIWAIVLAETWEWFPFTMLMTLAALQMIPGDPHRGGCHRRREPLADVPLHRAAVPAADARRLRAVPPDRQHQGVPADLRPHQRRARNRDGGHQLLRLRAGVQLLLLGLRQRDRHDDGGRSLRPEPARRAAGQGAGQP